MVDLTKEEVIRLKDVAAMFGVNRRTVANWIDRGLDAVYMGKLIVTTKEELQRFSRPVRVAAAGLDNLAADVSAADAAAAHARKRFKL